MNQTNTELGFLSGMHGNFTKKAVHNLIEKTLFKMLFEPTKPYIIGSENIGMWTAEYIITHYIESDTASTVSSGSAETYVIPAKDRRTLLPDRNISPRHCLQADFLGQHLDQSNSYYNTFKSDIFFVRCLRNGSCEELLLMEVKTIPSISDQDMQQLVNYMLPTFLKQGNDLGLFLTFNNAMLVKL